MIVQCDWVARLPLEQQGALLMACRAPDTSTGEDAKAVIRALRATVMHSARYGRDMTCVGDPVLNDPFMDHRALADTASGALRWALVTRSFHDASNALPVHAYHHVTEAAGLCRKHPFVHISERWAEFYSACAQRLGLRGETVAEMDARLCDWNHRYWTDEARERARLQEDSK